MSTLKWTEWEKEQGSEEGEGYKSKSYVAVAKDGREVGLVAVVQYPENQLRVLRNYGRYIFQAFFKQETPEERIKEFGETLAFLNLDDEESFEALCKKYESDINDFAIDS